MVPFGDRVLEEFMASEVGEMGDSALDDSGVIVVLIRSARGEGVTVREVSSSSSESSVSLSPQ